VVREVRALIGADYSGPAGPGRPEPVGAFVGGLLRLAAATGGEVDIVQTQPNDLHTPRPRGVLTPDRVPEVLAAVEL